MKIKVKEAGYEAVMAMPVCNYRKPVTTSRFFRWLMKVLSAGELKRTNFVCHSQGMEKLAADEPCLILMNHSSFIDLKIAATVLYPRPFQIVCTSDGFVGKEGLMYRVGCTPTRKFVTDPILVKNMHYALHKIGNSVLMYPEASYSFDGTATPLPDTLGRCVKMLQVPVIMIRTYGAFAHDPLYNNLQQRKVDVSADMIYLLSKEDVQTKSAEEIQAILKQQFSFDYFKWQKENHVTIREPFRADHLNRVLYKCPACKVEQQMIGKGTKLTCNSCGKRYELQEDGSIQAEDGNTEFSHIPDWYRWERECVKQELSQNTYRLDIDVDICMMVNMDAIYHVGGGRLVHTKDGFHLTGCDGKIDYYQKPQSSYSLYSDYYWYEIGDMICIGDGKALYYCFPKNHEDVVAKTRLATEELYKISQKK